MQPVLLIAEDDADMAKLVGELADAAGLSVRYAASGAVAMQALEAGVADAVATDLRLPDPDGLELLKAARDLYPEMPVIMITGYATTQNAIDAFRLGAFDLIQKPFDVDAVRMTFQRVHDLLAQKRRVEQLLARLGQLEEGAVRPVMSSRAMVNVTEMIERVADADIPVLLTGETGTGKSMLARLIHSLGPNRHRPFFALNCAGIAASLMESELFGHEKGAFTGATQRKRGLLELADGGTLLLDEINSAAPEVQVRLLQFLQDRTLMRVGGQEVVRVDVRLVCATNQELQALVQDGRFRADLYYRLSAFPIELPPLRERPEDILSLAEAFLGRCAHRLNRPARGFSPEAARCIRNYGWFGNVRELENVVQRAVVLARGPMIEPVHLPQEMRQPATPGGRAPSLPVPPDATLAEVEAYWINAMLERCRGNKTEAARRLGIDVSTLHRRLRQ